MGVADWFHHLGQGQQSIQKRLGAGATDPYYRFRSVAELRRAAALGERIDVNCASVDDWLRLPGLSIHQARLLVELSRSGVPFHGLEDVAAALSMPIQRLQPLAPILQFCYYEHESAPLTLNPNTASLEDWLQLPGIDSPLADRILAERQRQGVYRNLLDFQQRLQLPSLQIAELMHYLSW